MTKKTIYMPGNLGTKRECEIHRLSEKFIADVDALFPGHLKISVDVKYSNLFRLNSELNVQKQERLK